VHRETSATPGGQKFRMTNFWLSAQYCTPCRKTLTRKMDCSERNPARGGMKRDSGNPTVLGDGLRNPAFFCAEIIERQRWWCLPRPWGRDVGGRLPALISVALVQKRTDQRRDFRSIWVPQFGNAPANLNYLLSAVSCWCVCFSADFIAAINGSALAGTCILPDSVSRKETSLPYIAIVESLSC